MERRDGEEQNAVQCVLRKNVSNTCYQRRAACRIRYINVINTLLYTDTSYAVTKRSTLARLSILSVVHVVPCICKHGLCLI
jgi:hypothetical protein